MFRRAAAYAGLALLALAAAAGCSKASEAPPPPGSPRAAARPDPSIPSIDGTAIVLLVDLSGSMADQVPNRDGVREPKIAIATRALNGILSRLEVAAGPRAAKPADVPGAPPAPRRRVDVGLYTFSGRDVRVVRPLRPFDAEDLRGAVRRIGRPDGSTPLGKAVDRASRDLDDSGLRRRHELVITDGANTSGPDPAGVLRAIVDRAKGFDRTPPGVHFVAFDVDAAVFAGVKQNGATVVSASDEMQLGERLTWILETKILLEDEEPAVAPAAK